MQDSVGDDLRLLYEITVSDLAYFKTQQWNVSYYSLLIDAGLLGVSGVISSPLTIVDRVVLCGLALLGATSALFVLNKLQRSVEVRQTRLDRVREYLSDSFRKAWSAHYKEDDRISAIHLLRGGIVLTALLAVWLLGFRL